MVKKTEARYVVLWRSLPLVFAWVEKWVGVVGDFWATYWVLLVGSFSIAIGIALKWVECPFRQYFRGINLPIFRDAGFEPHISLFSFGVLGFGALVAGIILARYTKTMFAAAAAILLTLFALVPAYIAFEQPAMLHRLIEENDAAPDVRAFSRDFLTTNYGPLEIVPKHPDLSSAWARFIAAWSFLRLGWYCFGFGAVLVALYSLGRLRGSRIFTSFAFLGLPIASLVIVSVPPMIGEYFYSRGSVAEAAGHNAEAIDNFRKAMRWDAWHLQDINLYATIGELQRLTGMNSDTPEQKINHALKEEKLSEYEPALFELKSVADQGGVIGEVANHEAARAYIALGLALYQAGGFGSAVTNWEQAVATDPNDTIVLPYLARGYYDISDYPSSIKIAEQLATVVKNHTDLLANAYSQAGDSAAKLGDDAKARDYYNLSLLADPIENYWALTGLAGE